MKIKLKLITAFLFVIMLLMVSTLIINQSMLTNAIYSDYEEQGHEEIAYMVRHTIRNMADATTNYITFLAKDSTISKSAYYATYLDSPIDLQAVLPEYKERLGLSFLEVANLEGTILYTSGLASDQRPGRLDAEIIPIAGGSAGPILTLDPTLDEFVIHSAAAIIRNKKPIGIIHGGYVLDDPFLIELAEENDLFLHDMQGRQIAATNGMALDSSFITETLSSVSAACQQDANSDDCQHPQFGVSRQRVDATRYLLVSSPLRLGETPPIGAAVVGINAMDMVNELNKSRTSTLMVFAVIGIIGVLISLYISRRITQPLVNLTAHMQAYGSGTSPNIVEIRTDTAEINTLMESFQSMTTARAQAETKLASSEAQLRLLLESTGEAIFGLDQTGVCTFANPACARILGYDDVTALIGQALLCKIIPPRGDSQPHNADIALIDAHRQGIGVHDDSESFQRSDGSTLPVEYHAYPIRNSGDIVGSVVTFNDITQRKQAEENIRRLNAELEHRVEQRTEELQQSNRSLEASLEQLKQTQTQLVQSEKMAALGSLVAGVAHEINTPVGVGVTAASHLEDKVATYAQRYSDGSLTKGDFESFLNVTLETSEMISINLRRAAELISSFKQVAVDQTSEELRLFNLHDYMQEVLRSLHPKLKKTQHKVVIDCPMDIDIYSYPGAFSQILTNLVMNSLIHGFEGQRQGEITIAARQTPSHLTVRYSDNGKGMSKEASGKIFDPFFTTKRGSGGSGLGMHITYNLVTQTLEGQIECTSSPGQGTTFNLTLPLKHVEAHTTVANPLSA